MQIELVYLFGGQHLLALPSGQHSYIAVIGRKHVRLIDWITCETYRIERKVYDREKPRPTGFSKKRIIKIMRLRMKYLSHHTKFIKDVMKELKQ